MPTGSAPCGVRSTSKVLTDFRISTPTEVHFGHGASKAISSVLSPAVSSVLFVRGGSGIASASVWEDLQKLEVDITEVSIGAEPSIESINTIYCKISDKKYDIIVGCGGGAVIDSAKALRFCLGRGKELPSRLETAGASDWNGAFDLPLIVIPTTAGTGSEVTSNAVLSADGTKVSLRGRCVAPSIALVDPRLLPGAPKQVILGAGLDAVVQTMEAFCSRNANAYTDALTEPNLQLGAKSLRDAVEIGHEHHWTKLAWISVSSGLALANGGLGAAHGLAAVLGGRLNAPHGLLCGRLLGPVLLQNRSCVELSSEAFKRIETCIDVLTEAFRNSDTIEPLEGFDSWLKRHRVPRLRNFDLCRNDFDEIAEAAVFASSSTKNPVPLKKSDFRHILEAAY